MRRISTDAEWLDNGIIRVDADGIPVDVPDRSDMDAADEALGRRVDLLLPSSIRAGQVLKWDGAKFIPSWLDQHTNLYDNAY